MLKNDFNFETAINNLEKTVKALETGELSLEETIEKFQEGVGLVKICHRRLNEAQRKIEILVRSMDDELAENISEGRDV